MESTLWKTIFAPDHGALLNIRIYRTLESDYDRLLRLLESRYVLSYAENGISKPLPRYETISQQRELVSVCLTIDVADVHVNCFFWTENEITLDLLPEDVDSFLKAQSVFSLMKAIASQLNKRVLLTAEDARATEKWSEEYAICVADPLNPEIIFRSI